MDQEALARKAEVAELLLDAARHLGETLEPERVYERFHELLEDVVPHDGLVVSTYDERDDLIRCEYAWVEGNVIEAAGLPPLPLNRSGGGMQSRVIVSGEALLFNDVVERVQRDGQFYNVDREGTIEKLPDAGPAGTNAAIMVPVKHEGRVVGVVQVMTDRGQYSGEQLELVEGLVAQMAAAVRNARLQQERRRLEAAEAAARAAAAEWEQAAQVLDAVGDGIFLLEDGVVRLWNRAAETVTGVPAAAVRDRRLVDVVPEWRVVAEAIPIAAAGERPRPVTLPVDFGGRDVWLSFVAVTGASGIVYAFRDMTSERRLEEEKADFVATVSHELRTPMAAVYGAAETLRRRADDLTPDQRQQLVEMIAAQSARLTQITEEVLLTNRLDRGEVRVERERVDLASLVETTVDAMTAHASDLPPVAVEVEEGAIATGDADRIQQVLVNLIDNAVKYGDESPVRVRVENAEDAVRIVVADEGPGILAGEQERIFEKFYRGDPQLTRAPGGTGLGLYISRELARRMGGRLDLESPPGRGAAFVLELPRR